VFGVTDKNEVRLFFEGTMKITAQLLNKAPLTDYERKLIKLIDIEKEKISDVAKKFGKHKSTISTQHKRAREKLEEFMKMEKKDREKGAIASKVFRLFEKGCSPCKVVMKLNLSPEHVKELYNSWIELKEMDLSSPILPKILNELKQKVEDLDLRLGLIEDVFYDILGDMRCPNCGNRFHAIHIKCTKCGMESWWSICLSKRKT